MTAKPRPEINSAIEAGVVDVTRRIEIYQKDGVTPWYASADDDPFTERLVDGSISLDYNSDERRKGEVTLRNDDGAFRLNPVGGFYYDKVIKLYRGVRYSASAYKPKIAIIETEFTGDALTANLRTINAAGYEATVLPMTANIADLEPYGIVMNLMNGGAGTRWDFMNEAWNAGKAILSVGSNETGTPLNPLLNSFGGLGGGNEVHSYSNDHPLKKTLVDGQLFTTASGNKIALGITAGTIPVAYTYAGVGSYMIAARPNKNGAWWFDLHTPGVHHNGTGVMEPNLKAILDYLSTKGEKYVTWEAQLGSFMVDQVNDQIRVPNQVKITFRDFTKKLLKDKLTFTSSFPAGTPLKQFIRSIAANGGITDFREAIGPEVFPAEMAFERDTERWKMIKDACTAFDYECYFDNEGYLVVRKFNDPTTAPIFHSFGTGPDGNLVDFSRSINDSRIYNIINVFGDPVEDNRLPYFGQAINDDVNSPTSTVNLGKRPFTYAFNYFASDAECLALARSRLSVMGLESYDINFSSIYYPWMEVGEIVQILDPYRNATDPTRFLMDTLTLPLGLGPMSGTGKRVTLVGSPG